MATGLELAQNQPPHFVIDTMAAPAMLLQMLSAPKALHAHMSSVVRAHRRELHLLLELLEVAPSPHDELVEQRVLGAIGDGGSMLDSLPRVPLTRPPLVHPCRPPSSPSQAMSPNRHLVQKRPLLDVCSNLVTPQ